MEGELHQLQNRFRELAERAATRGRPVFTPFLTLAEQDALLRMERQLAAPVQLLGGYEWAERRMACFGEARAGEEPPETPACWVEITPDAPRFAQGLTHRDFLGAVMALGLKREQLGDLITEEGRAWIFCLEESAPFLCQSLAQVGRMGVSCAVGEPPPAAGRLPEESSVVVSSPRLDGLIAAVWNRSRSESQGFFAKELVFVNGRLTVSPAYQPREGEIVSVRGVGRFRYEGIARETRKGRLRVTVRIYGR